MPEKVPFALKFSNRNVGPNQYGTIWQHKQLIDRFGYCWWGWWRSQNPTDLDTDHTSAFQSAIGRQPIRVGLFSRSLSRAYIATINKVDANNGAAIPTPQSEQTPAYYRADPYPAWFRMTDIQRLDGKPIDATSELEPEDSGYQIRLLVDRFRELGESTATVLWRDSVPTLPTLTSTTGSQVLHLSDLHFGINHEWTTEQIKRPGRISQFEAIRRTLKDHAVEPKNIGVIAISGDISDFGPDPERYMNAKRLLDDLFDITECNANNLVIVPGNHDVTRHSIDPSGNTGFQFNENVYDDRQKAGEREYNAFCDSVFGENSAITRLRRFDTPNNAVNILQLNSTLPRDQANKEYGFFGLEPLEHFDNMLRLLEAAHEDGKYPLNMAVSHHHPISTVKAEFVPNPSIGSDNVHDPVSTMVDQSNLIDWCTQYKVRFLLHGHQHKTKFRSISDRFSNAGGNKLFFTEILSAGTSGAKFRADDDPMAFNVYDLNGETVRIRALPMDIQLSRRPALFDFSVATDGTPR